LKLRQITYFQNTGILPATAKLAVKYRPGRLNTGHLATLVRRRSCAKTPERGCITGAPPLLPFERGATGAQVPLHNRFHKQLHDLSRLTWNKFIAAIRAHIKLRMISCNFCY